MQWPMEQGDHRAALNGLQAWFRVRGSGPVCLFPTPGWGASADLYFETLKPLERWFTMVYLDTRGSGRSARSLSDEDYLLKRFVADLEALRKLAGERAVWVMGHSLGGLLAQEYAVRHPASCRGLVLLDSTAAIDETFALDHDRRVGRRAAEAWFAEAHAALNREDDIASDAEFKAHLDAILPFYFHDVSKLEPGTFGNVSLSIEAYAMMRVNRDAFRAGALARLHEVEAPTAIVVGDDDFICSPAQALRIHLRIKGSKLVVVPEAGHFPWLEQPDLFYAGLEDALRHLGAFAAPAAV